MRDRFAEALSMAREELVERLDPEPRSRTRSVSGFRGTRNRQPADRHAPPAQELERYWRLYKSCPLLKAPINQFADDVVEAGYRIKADNSRTEEYLQEWAESGAIVAGDRDTELIELIREIPIQTEVRGTALVEHAPAREDRRKFAALTLVDPSTITPYTRPGTNILVGPDETSYSNVKTTDQGKAAAYVQYDRGAGYGSDDPSERRLSLDDATKFVNDPDVTDIFGESSIASCADRVEAIQEKMLNNEQAIESLAWGQFFVGFEPLVVKNEHGADEVIEWEKSSMDDTMDRLEEIGPGELVGTDGKIDINNIPGEVADIIDLLHFDVHYILTSMPAPTFSVGFEKDINQFVTASQEKEHEKRVAAMRQYIERRITPILRTVAEQAGLPTSGIVFTLEPEDEESPILSLTNEQIERIERYAAAADDLSGSADATTLIDDDVTRELILQLPENSGPDHVAEREAAELELDEEPDDEQEQEDLADADGAPVGEAAD